MDLTAFSQALSGICFVLAGLWWTVVSGRKDWLRQPSLRGLAGRGDASFLIPGAMALSAQIGGENTLVWGAVFAIAAVLGLVFGVAPELAAPIGRKAIQVEACLVSIIVLTGHGLACERMTFNPEAAP